MPKISFVVHTSSREAMPRFDERPDMADSRARGAFGQDRAEPWQRDSMQGGPPMAHSHYDGTFDALAGLCAGRGGIDR